MKPLLGALLLFFAPSAFGWWFGTLQKITVNGTLSCDKNYVAIIKLRDHDLFDPDDTLAEINDHGSLAEGRCFTIDFEVPQDNIGGTYKLALVKLRRRRPVDGLCRTRRVVWLEERQRLVQKRGFSSATAQVRLSKENVGNATGSPRVVPSDVVSGRKLN
ncbi:hypothetical protein L596_028938 [Steinernema carpocapsae]|uniref:Uncharacterized protein n=1 Tax=Steinernema carpocapsae TaxID=34508 RepID=A0A4U5LZY0_STECR|nr:hypothetical protein L596_028938 [Steinernema carpocapsae]